MEKFCTKCGRPLVPGERCVCETGKSPVPQAGGLVSRGMPGANPAQGRQAGPGINPAQGRQAGPGINPAQGRQAGPGINPAQGRQAGPGINPAQSRQAYQQAQPQQAYQRQPQYQQQQAYQQQQYNLQQQYAGQQVQQVASGHLSKVIGTFINIVKRPVETGRQLVAYADMGVIVSLIILQAVVSGFFDVAVMMKISNMIPLGVVKMPAARSFFVTVMASASLSFALAGILLVGNMAVKNTVNYKQMLACAAVRSVTLVLTSLAATLLFVLIPSIGAFVFFTGGLWGYIAMSMVMPKHPGIDENKLPLLHFLAAVSFLLLFLVFIRICWKAYLPDVAGLIGNGLDSLLENPGSILEDLF